MADKSNGNPVTAFARQVKRERTARGWTLDELARRTGIAAAHWSRIENGHRAPTEKIALAADAAFGGKWFWEEYEESRDYLPPGLRSWTEIEDKAARLSVWAVSVVHGLFQTPDYSRVWLEALPGATPEKVRWLGPEPGTGVMKGIGGVRLERKPVGQAARADFG